MKRYYLHQKEDPDANFIADLGILHESHRKIIVTYAHLNEPSRFIQTLKENCQKTQRYHLTKEHSLPTKTILKDYLVLGINDVAKMIYFTEIGDAKWLAEYKLELLAPRSFYLNWNKNDEFVVEWA